MLLFFLQRCGVKNGEQEKIYSLFFSTLSLNNTTTALSLLRKWKKKLNFNPPPLFLHSGFPPVTAISAPETYVFPGSARNTNAEAPSAGCAARPSG